MAHHQQLCLAVINSFAMMCEFISEAGIQALRFMGGLWRWRHLNIAVVSTNGNFNQLLFVFMEFQQQSVALIECHLHALERHEPKRTL